MKAVFRVGQTCALATLGLFVASSAAQAPASGDTAQSAPVKLSSADLQDLVAPIALYPDALIAHILPASTAALDLVQAARFLRKNNGKADPRPNQKWNTSVFVLLQFPDVIYRMDENLDWTQSLGQAVLAQQADVMKSIQAIRASANAAGTLQSNDKQSVVIQQDVVQIVPTDPQIVYVPTYNPNVVVANETSNAGQTAAAAAVGFGVGVAVGALLNNDSCDWYGGYVYHGAYPVHYGTYVHPAHPYNPRGPYDPRGIYDPRGVADPRGRYDPRGAADPRGRVDPRGAGTAGRAGAGGQAGHGGTAGAGRERAGGLEGRGGSGSNRRGVSSRSSGSGSPFGGYSSGHSANRASSRGNRSMGGGAGSRGGGGHRGGGRGRR
jgi:hypothetical protein